MVNWQKTEYSRELDRWKQKTGLSPADINPNNQYGNHSVVEMVLPSIFLTVLYKIGESSNNNSNPTESDADAAARAEQIRNDIQTIYDKYKEQGVTNISDLEAYLQGLCDEKDTNINTLEKNIKANKDTAEELTSRNNDITERLNAIPGEINNINSEISNLTNSLNNCEPSEKAEIQAKINKLQLKIEELNNEKTRLTQEQADNNTNITKAQNAVSTDTQTLNTFQGIQKDIDNLKTLSKQLKKAEGKDAIEDLTNDQTADIAGLIKKMNNAEIKGDSEKANQYKKELTEALKEYVKNPDNKNKTILNYAAKLGIK